jgi:hypothetical protein
MNVTTELNWDDFFTTTHPDEAHEHTDDRPVSATGGAPSKN